MKKTVVLAAIALLSITVAFAADISGKWTGQMPVRGGELADATFVFKVDGEKLTGKLTTPGRGGGEPVTTEITDGTIKDGAISFKISRDFGGNSFVQTYTGKIAGKHPYSWVKIFFAILAVLILIGVIYFFAESQ